MAGNLKSVLFFISTQQIFVYESMEDNVFTYHADGIFCALVLQKNV